MSLGFLLVIALIAVWIWGSKEFIKKHIIARKKQKNRSKEQKLQDAMRFNLLATQLKDMIRTGWGKTHWNVNKERMERIAENVYCTCILAISIDSEFELDLEIDKIMKMLVLHEVEKVIIGEHSTFEKITPKEKNKAMKKVFGKLIKKEEYDSLLTEFDEMQTEEAIFAHLCDKMEKDIQTKAYQDRGCQYSLEEQEKNIIFKNSSVQQMAKKIAIKMHLTFWRNVIIDYIFMIMFS